MYQIKKKDIFLLKQHDKFTYEKIRKHYINPLCLFLSNEFNLCKAEVEDLADTIFIKVAYLKIDLYDLNKGSFLTWLFTIAKNYCIDYLKNNVNVSYLHSNKNVEDLASTEDKFEFFYALKMLLGEEEYNYLICYFVYEMTMNEIANKYSVSKSTVCYKINHAKKLIKLHRKDLRI